MDKTSGKENRRSFIKNTSAITGAILTGGLANSCMKSENNNNSDAPADFNIITNKKFNWRCVTTWPPNFPVLGEAVVKMAEELKIITNGQLNIKVYGGGELVPSLEVFDAVTQGAAQMGHGASYYWAGKMPSSVFFCTIPFGMNAQQINSWMLHGDGWKLWKELYAQVNLLPFPCGNTGVQMGGWFNKEINTIQDLQGLKMRIPGLGGKVISRAGTAAVTIAAGELYTNLERGVIDATEWIGPYHDYLMGFHKVAKYYYYPGWHEPGSCMELFINKSAFEELPKNIQLIVENTALKYNLWVLSEFEAKNNFYLQKILNESDAQLKKFPDEVLFTLKDYAGEVIDEITSKDAFAKKVFENFSKFKKEIVSWNDTSEQAIIPYL
ncbi:TRAP transporter substrate-binding protein [Chondrinema litorale]|uniref:TRAP transporter substrate-binding protein n=1 Tax=Chondrinema litorale TaxID=2994555 RepID=UPI0025429A33|nr:TRAP transporter substrate-binding protein DctP [Chondrinema litorale]UZR92290.1 TRAP transporter substrate-binding protein DctP [Chondrinema litorale]